MYANLQIPYLIKTTDPRRRSPRFFPRFLAHLLVVCTTVVVSAISSSAAAPPATWTTGHKKVLIIPVRFTDAAGPSDTPSANGKLSGWGNIANGTMTAQMSAFMEHQSSVSHEFRTPLGIILSGADLLDSFGGQLTPERVSEVLAEIKDNTGRMNEMVERLLLLGSIESSKLHCERGIVNIAVLCREIARRNTTVNPGAVVLSVNAPDLDPMLDASLLDTVLGNLLSNAVKYSAPGATVTLDAQVQNGWVIFTVRDEGIGIPEEDAERVFDPFHRCGNVGDKPGTGLGLGRL